MLKESRYLQPSNLKQILTKLKTGEINWAEVDQAAVLATMVEHIGSTDSVLRDKLIYTMFYRLIVEQKVIDSETMLALMDKSLEELLFKGIEFPESDDVFTRAFTSLLLALILHRDIEENFLTIEQLTRIKNALISYIIKEKDLRGYVQEKGWAHSVAHVAGTFGELIKNPKFQIENYEEILQALWNKIFFYKNVYVHGEDERLLVPIILLVEKGLDVQILVDLIDEIPVRLHEGQDQLPYHEYLLLEFNVKTFLKGMYIEVVSLRKSIEECLKKL